jgi:hypothetical protein
MKVPNPRIGATPAKESREQHELIVLHKDGATGSEEGRNAIGEHCVDRDIGVPPCARKVWFNAHIMKKRPQRRIAKTFVVLFNQRLRQRNGVKDKAAQIQGILATAVSSIPPHPGCPGAR